MKKKTVILTTIAVLILAVVLGFCYIPLPYHHTINAFRIDSLVDRDRDDVEPVNDYLYRVCVSEDLEQWIISVNTNNESYIHYMGSVSGKKPVTNWQTISE